jgi:hypothetical protein
VRAVADEPELQQGIAELLVCDFSF